MCQTLCWRQGYNGEKKTVLGQRDSHWAETFPNKYNFTNHGKCSGKKAQASAECVIGADITWGRRGSWRCGWEGS